MNAQQSKLKKRRNELYERKAFFIFNSNRQNTFYCECEVGKTTFIVNVKQSESAKKPLDTVFKEICKHEVLGDFLTDKSSNLEKLQKSS